MTNSQTVIVAALELGALLYEPRNANGWFIPTHRRGRDSRRYFRKSDVNSVIAMGLARQFENLVVKA